MLIIYHFHVQQDYLWKVCVPLLCWSSFPNASAPWGSSVEHGSACWLLVRAHQLLPLQQCVICPLEALGERSGCFQLAQKLLKEQQD